jgi:hypothetical protein
MPPDYLRRIDPTDPGSPMIVVGVYDTHYRVNTVYEIDSNLADLRADHPDVDRLLDARRIVSAVNAAIPAGCTHAPDLPCPPEPGEPCTCALVMAPQYVVDAWHETRPI